MHRPTFPLRWWSLVALLIAVGVGAGCSWGTTPKHLVKDLGPRGVQVALRVRGEARDRVGELYAVDSIGLMVREVRLIRVRWSQVGAMDVHRLGQDYDIAPDELVGPAKRERLLQVSRFRDALHGPLLDAVLAQLKQPTLVEIP